MTRYLLAAGFIAALSFIAGATETGAGSDRDCAMARDPVRCLAMRQARQACQEKRGGDKRRCLREKMPAPDCPKAPDPGRCLARQQAQEACKGKAGKEMLSCRRALEETGAARAAAKK